MALDVGANVPYLMMLPDPVTIDDGRTIKNHKAQQTFSVSQVPLIGHWKTKIYQGIKEVYIRNDALRDFVRLSDVDESIINGTQVFRRLSSFAMLH